eukprot:TRINITY_DN4045_c1_g1_i2.p1 TRINITY_DN4045_c1_g1~~TRINITY_DN4045_c1_g1_i2.p1  ORF type:complete len:1175 (+),score=133.84 TRINITY_DN4045_c1_g1_i2:590-4114(+)
MYGNIIVPSYAVNWTVPVARRVVTTSATVINGLETPYTIGYLGYSNIITQSSKAQVAKVINSRNNAVGPDAEYVLSAINDFGLTTYKPNNKRDDSDLMLSLVGTILNGPGEYSYPFSSYAYFALRTKSHENNCRTLTKFLDFVLWTQSYTDAAAVLDIFGATSLPASMESRILETLATIECQGSPALDIAGCLLNGIICASHGSCVDGACVCNGNYKGTFCTESADSGISGDTTAYIAAFATAFPLLFCCCVLILVASSIIIFIFARPSDKAWAVDFDELELKQQIGAGGYGAVHKAVWKDSDVAVKLLANSHTLSRDVKRNFVSEVKVMTQLRHPNVVLFMGACTKPPNLCIIMEFMELGSLYDVIHNELVPRLPMGLRIKLAAQAAQGMHFLHSSGILHRDLKSPNILLDDKWNAKISDFGLTVIKQESGSDLDRLAGSLLWTAPEILGEESSFVESADVFSFGIILWELLTSKDPYSGMNPTTVAVRVLRDDIRPKMPLTATPEYAELTRNCWDKDTEVRPTFLEIVTRLKAMASSTSSDESKAIHSSETSNFGNSSVQLTTTSSSSDSSKGNIKKFAAVDNAVQAPTGDIVLVVTDIYRAGTLWEFNPEVMKEATILHNTIIRESLAQYHGYEAGTPREGVTGEGSFCIAFQRVEDAINWVIAVQKRLLEADWNEKLLAHPAAAEEWAGEHDTIIFKGLRLRMAMHYGTMRAVRDPMTRRIGYTGPLVSKAVLIVALANGGQIIATAALRKAMKHSNADLSSVVTVSLLGKSPVSETESIKLFELKPVALAGRFFGGLSLNRIKTSGSRGFLQSTLNSSSESDVTDYSSNSIALRSLKDTNPTESYINSANLCRWVIDYDHIKVGKQVGMGSYGMVYKARWKAIDVAVKRFMKQQLSERHLLDFRAEVAFLSEMHHPNIVLFIGACMRQPNLCIVTEYVKQGSLKDVLMNKSIKLPWQTRMKIAKGAALGVYYLHSLDPVILHRDLKSSNILIDENWNAKVADFGFARIKQDNATMTRCGSPCWTAPEIIKGEKYTEKADVYSFGIILWEILTRQQPYKGLNFMNVGIDVINGARPKIPSNTPARYAKLMTRCWHANEARRPSMKKIINFFTHLETGRHNSVSSDGLSGPSGPDNAAAPTGPCDDPADDNSFNNASHSASPDSAETDDHV